MNLYWFLNFQNVFFKIARKLFKGRGEKVNLNMFCLFTVQAILNYYWRVFNGILKKSPKNIISPIYFLLNAEKMVNFWRAVQNESD
jgi:hypothetical protein